MEEEERHCVKGKPINKSIRVLQPFSTSPVLPITTTLHPSLCLENSKKYIANSKTNLASSKIQSNFNFSGFLPSVFRVAAPLVALLFLLSQYTTLPVNRHRIVLLLLSVHATVRVLSQVVLAGSILVFGTGRGHWLGVLGPVHVVRRSCSVT